MRYFEEARFVDVVETHFQWPMNTWPKDERMEVLGAYWQDDMTRGLVWFSMAVLTRFAGMTKEAVLEMTAKVRENIRDEGIHAYLPV